MGALTDEQKKDANTRTIVLMYGLLEDGGPFWLYAAVKPSQYQSFMAAQKDGSLDVYKFEQYGEIIISGKGRTPPDDITLKIAELYQTDPDKLKMSDDAWAAKDAESADKK